VTESEPSPLLRRSSGRWRVVVGISLLLIASGVLWNLQPAPDMALARRLLDTGDQQNAQTELESILTQNPQHAEALLALGDLLRTKGDLIGATGCFRRVPPDSAQFRQASIGQMQTLLEMSDLAGAEQQMQRHLASFPDERLVWDELRWLCFNEFRTRDVEELSHWWLKSHSDDTQALTHLLLGVFRPQVPQEGTTYLQEMDAACGQQVPVILALAWAAWQSGKIDEASRLLEQAWQIDAGDVRTRILSAEILIEEQRFAEAARVLKEDPFQVAGEMFGDQTDRWYWLRSRILLEQGMVAEALQHVELAIDRGNGCSAQLEYIHSQAVLCNQLGRDQEAIEAFHTARTIERCRKRLAEIAFSGAWENPTPELRLELAELYQQSGNDRIAELWRR